LGVHISIDNFGTSCANLSSMRKLRIHTLKIDQSLVSGIESDRSSEDISRAVIGLARSLKMNVTAEGVETEAQRKVLESLNCQEMQGYVFSRPIPPEECTALLDKKE